MHRTCLAFALGLLLLPRLPLNAQTLPDDRQIVTLCRQFSSPFGDAKKEAAAYAALEKLPRQTRARRLNGLFAALKPETLDYAGVAYTLAYYGVETRRNVERLVLPYTRYARKPGYSARNSTLLEAVPDQLERLYRRRHEDFLLDTVLALPGDGHIAEILADSRLNFFLRSPEPVLRYHARRGKIKALAEDLREGDMADEDGKKMHAALEKALQSGDAVVRRAAQECLTALKKPSP